MLPTDLFQFFNFLTGILNPVAQTAIFRHALPHVINVDILLHADIFFYKFLQLDVHAERNRTFKQQRELFRVQAAQINIIELFAETLVVGTEIAFFFGIVR